MNPLLIILGPTASGKTHLANQVATRINGEILSVDSRQVYRGMNIGTGKDLEEYVVDGRQILYHLIDILDAGDKYNVNLFQQDFQTSFLDITNRDKVPVACGGTGFYFYALLKGHAYTDIPVDEKLREELEEISNEDLLSLFNKLVSSYQNLADTSTRKRLIRAIEISTFLVQNPEKEILLQTGSATIYNPIVFGLNPPAEIRRERISQRLDYRLKNGLIEEVESLLKSGISAESLIYYGLEYKYVTQYVTGLLSYEEMHKRLETEIHRFAKRQMTFFRKMEKDGIIINWLDYNNTEEENIKRIIMAYNSFTQNI
ncbi:tRNA (adenosine(37)-N6)-dimethylallyltransferase MiaA [Dyadobacter frigoris]|uniref:tRNA dimethylallyltransferase n=1 Tax=Dyadobacter frigoris TaxID=2576211 RepID=A0A4V6Y1W1_9BACT|nr:tRNA (adenosine(37)-N6)-dimethylallyltransferase MiaA [Dyadobacter frigoris]TKT88903.1 tRNA (adenosine(37)-N6)-dimethylallyltransferase MiaA [Dyadobacter frigoris]GLU56097.1 tRNA dimethylallyltransferase 2 [Dyadobacter frigoris]